MTSSPERELPPVVVPQSLMLTFLGEYVLGRDIVVPSGTFLAVFDRLGVSEQAVRSTLTRMVARGLLVRQRQGQRMCFGLTPRASAVLADGRRRVWAGAVDRTSDGTWTLLGFSLPETRRDERHGLRSRLRWAGFGPLQSGLWLAPGAVDVEELVADLGVRDSIRVFVARPADPTDVGQMVRDAYDLAGLAARYAAFVERWDGPAEPPHPGDDLARLLRLNTEWLLLVRDDPRLPLKHLPADWPAVRAEELFARLNAASRGGAEAAAAALLDPVPLADVEPVGVTPAARLTRPA